MGCNVLVDHTGKLIEDVGYFWGHAEHRHKIAHDYLIVNYVYTSGKHYPLEFYRYRWTGTECFHRDAKQHLGMGDCQLRNGQGQTRHLYMVFLAYSALIRQMQQSRARAWALERLTTIGQACMAVLRESFSQTLSWAFDRIEQDRWDFELVKIHLSLP
jgi:hypothetical protein